MAVGRSLRCEPKAGTAELLVWALRSGLPRPPQLPDGSESRGSSPDWRGSWRAGQSLSGHAPGLSIPVTLVGTRKPAEAAPPLMLGLPLPAPALTDAAVISRRLMRLTYDVRLVTPRVIPTSSASHVQMVFMLCPTARAASMSGQSARIWPDLVAGFSARRRARRVRACIARSAEFMRSSFPGTDPLSTTRLPKANGDGHQRIPHVAR